MPEYRSSPCPACGESHRENLGKPDLSRDPVGAPAETAIVRCGRCGHLRVDPMPWWSDDDFRKLYGDGYFVPDSPRWARLRAEVNPAARLGRLLPLLGTAERTVLEVGAGIYAHFCILLRSRGWSVQAQEPSADFRAILEAKGLAVDARSFESIPEDRRFALIYADSVFEHVPDPLAYFRKAATLLEPGGVLYLVVPRERSLLGLLKHAARRMRGKSTPFLSAYRPPYHLHGFTSASLRSFAASSGLRVGLVFLGEDWFWLQALERLPFGIGHLAAAVLWCADRVGWGGNLEVALVKDPG